MVEHGCYSSRYVGGVYVSSEAAKRAQSPHTPEHVWSHYPEDVRDDWHNQLDFDNHIEIMERDVEE